MHRKIYACLVFAACVAATACKKDAPAAARLNAEDTVGVLDPSEWDDHFDKNLKAEDIQDYIDPNDPQFIDLTKMPRPSDAGKGAPDAMANATNGPWENAVGVGATDNIQVDSALVDGSLAADATGSAWKLADDFFSTSLCSNLRASGRPTNECKDYCDTFNPISSVDVMELRLTWATFATWFPKSWRDNIASTIANGSSMSGRATAGGLGAASSKAICAASAIGYALAEYYDYQRCQTNPNTSCVACGSAAYTRTTCRIYDALRGCAQAFGAKIPWFTPVGVLARSCSIGVTAQREVYRYSCRTSCDASVKTDVPVAQAKTIQYDNGTNYTERLCCRCVREYRQNGWVSNTLFDFDYYSSVTDSSKGPTQDCEGREGRKDYPEPPTTSAGYKVLYTYSNCERYFKASQQCSDAPGGQSFSRTNPYDRDVTPKN